MDEVRKRARTKAPLTAHSAYSLFICMTREVAGDERGKKNGLAQKMNHIKIETDQKE